MTGTPADSSSAESARSVITWTLFYATGLIGSLLVYGLYQERIMSVPYADGDMFVTSAFLVFCNRLAAVVFCAFMLWINGESFTWPQGVAWYVFIPSILVVSFSNVFASTCQYEALLYVSFPVQMLGKSFKMMPVMIWSMIISGASYKAVDWLIAAAVTGGVVEFLMTGPISSATGEESTAFKGLLLLALFLALDGITSPMQEKLFKTYQVSKYSAMMWVNSFSVVASFITLITTGGWAEAMTFVDKHPALLVDASTLSVSAVGGQWFIYSLIKYSGAVTFAATMNVRQMVSIIVSYITAGHHITGAQVLGLICVFSALFYKSHLGLAKQSGEKKPLLDKLGSPTEKETSVKS